MQCERSLMHNKDKGDLLSALETSQQALMTGDIEALAALTPDIGQGEATLRVEQQDQRRLLKIIEAAQKNAALLQAAAKGVKSARAKIAAISDVRDNLSLYTSEGAKKQIPFSQKKLEKKA